MDVVIADNEIVIRLACFFSLFIVLALAEMKFPRRELKVSKLLRWSNNLSMSVFNSILVKNDISYGGDGAGDFRVSREVGSAQQPATTALDQCFYLRHFF